MMVHIEVEGDWMHISPTAKRQFFAAENVVISYTCIQVKKHSPEGYTAEDAIL